MTVTGTFYIFDSRIVYATVLFINMEDGAALSVESRYLTRRFQCRDVFLQVLLMLLLFTYRLVSTSAIKQLHGDLLSQLIPFPQRT